MERGEIQGEFVIWYENGQKQAECRFEHSVPCGKVKCWTEQGQPDPCTSMPGSGCSKHDKGMDCSPCEGGVGRDTVPW